MSEPFIDPAMPAPTGDLPIPSPGTADGRANDGDLAKVIAAAAMSVPGVVRLEPSLGAALRHLTPRVRRSRGLRDVDGVRIQTTRCGAIEVAVDVVVSAPPSAREVATKINQQITRALSVHDITDVSVAVGVLSMEPAPATARNDEPGRPD